MREGLRNVAAGANPIALKKGIEKAVEAVTAQLLDQAKEVETKEEIAATADELQAAIDAYPFDRGQPKFCHVYFLAGKPSAAATEALVDRGLEELAVIGRDLHIRYAGGVAGTKLTTPLIHRTLGVVGTGRNLDTVAKLRNLAR